MSSAAQPTITVTAGGRLFLCVKHRGSGRIGILDATDYDERAHEIQALSENEVAPVVAAVLAAQA